MKKVFFLVPLLCMALICAAAPPAVQATELISNLPGNDASQSAALSDLRNKGMGFTMPAEQYNLDAATLRLETFGANTVPIVEIWSDVAGNPGAPLVTLINPVLASSGIASYDFIPPGTFVLEASTTYWVVAYGQAGATAYDWVASSPGVTPTGLATHAGAKFDTNGPPPTTNSSILCSYAVSGTTGPISVEPEGWGSIKAKYRD